MSVVPLVTVVVPVLDEAERIERCLTAILRQDWPAERLEVLVVDSGSRDGTVALASSLLSASGVQGRVIPNAGGGRSSNLNVGLAAATGDILCRVDGRSTIPPAYVRRCVEVLEDPTCVVVGGRQQTIAGGDSAQARGVARALDNRYAMGMARYRRTTVSGPADTVYLGAFRVDQLRSVGGWDASLEVNEDFDLNERMAGLGSVWFAADLLVGYEARRMFVELVRQYLGFGRWKVRYLRYRQARPRPLELVGLGVVPAAGVGLVSLVALPPKPRLVASACLAVGAAAPEAHGAGGSADRSDSAAVRGWSLLCCAAIAGSWSAGGWLELLAGGRGAPGPAAAPSEDGG